MNWAQFKDPVSHMCLVGTVVVSWSLTQEVAGSNPFTVTNIEEKSSITFFLSKYINYHYNKDQRELTLITRQTHADI